MAIMGINESWANRRVLVTGHTGFKGAWLTLWLRMLGARVCGIALEPDPKPGLLDLFQLADEIDHNLIDVRNAESLGDKIANFRPETVFHLAAQPLVRASYQQSVETWQTNVMGTIHVLESLKRLDNSVVAVVITTDKVYCNREWVHSYRETDRLGGYDPYSSSKAAAELAVSSWRQSFFQDPLHVALATVRAGNVIGGGDWAADRIFPDMMRSLQNNQAINVRNPNATRPWQHVLEPLGGYLRLAERLSQFQQAGDHQSASQFSSAWNFGPTTDSNRTVRELVETTLEFWPGSCQNQWQDKSEIQGNNPNPAVAPHEANFLGLTIDKANKLLQWYPRMTFRQSVRATVDWYRNVTARDQARSFSQNQITEYCN